MRVGSLFSGIGGFELGLEWAGVSPVVWQVEQDEWCRTVLAEHWPNARRYERVEDVGSHNLSRVDLICGGFPCQDISSAGARAGLTGSRSGLWYEFDRIVGELQPGWVVVENVTSGAMRWVDAVRGCLGERGYETLPVPMQADWIGAPYPRARVFVVARRLADAHREEQHVLPLNAEVARASSTTRLACTSREIADADGIELRKQSRRFGGSDGESPTVSFIDRWSEPMPSVDGVVPGAPRRVDAQRAAGNCVIPQCGEVIGWIIRLLESGRGDHRDL